MCDIGKDYKFANLGTPPGRIWAIPAIHGHVGELYQIHNQIMGDFTPGDQLLYLGNYIGYGPESVEVIDEILTFRRMILSIPGVFHDEITYLRGRQEEMLSKLLQLQFAPEAWKVLDWMLVNGMKETMESYGMDIDRGRRASLEGVTGLGQWTKQLHEKIKEKEGHEAFRAQLKRAAFTDMTHAHPLLFVHAGLEPRKALPIQGDNFWWSTKEFKAIETPYRPFERVLRGYDPDHEGVYINGVTATLDNGCGFGGNLVYARIDANSGAFDVLSV